MRPNNFTHVAFTAGNLDRYLIRTSIFEAIKSSLIHFKGSLLDVGCGKMPYKNVILKNSSVEKYIGLDIDNAIQYDAKVKPDFTWDGIKMPFEDASFETTFATEVLEHCPDPAIILNEIYRVMKHDGCFFFTVPFLWNLHEVPHDEYRYTPFALQRILEKANFKDIEIKATGGWHAAMAQMLGLWVRRAPIGYANKTILSYLLKPIIWHLIKKDKKRKIEFKERQMITGLYGVAFKRNSIHSIEEDLENDNEKS